MVYHKVLVFFSTHFISCNGPFAPKEKWHRKEHIIIIIIIIMMKEKKTQICRYSTK